MDHIFLTKSRRGGLASQDGTHSEYAFKTLNKFSWPMPWPSVKNAWCGNVLIPRHAASTSISCQTVAVVRRCALAYLPRSRVMAFSCELVSLSSLRYVVSISTSLDADLDV